MGKLREFDSWEDLSAHTSEELILAWVNHHAEMIRARDESGARYRKKQQMIVKMAKRLLDKDELDRIQAEVEERLSEKR